MAEKCILVVDDDKEVAKTITVLLNHILKKMNVKIITYTSPEKALQEFKKNPSGYYAAFLDYLMPQINGGELGCEMLKLNSKLKIFILTGFSPDFDSEKAKKIGFCGYLMKPFSIKEIRTLIFSQM